MRIGTGVETNGDLATVLGRFREAEAAGFHAVWVPNIFGYDAITLLALAGRVTERLELGTFVVPTYPRHPTAIAQQALTAAAATGGRFVLGIGLSHRIVIEDMFGLDFSKPVRHMREYLSVLMPLLERQPTRFQGEEFRVAAQLDLPVERRPQVIVAALGPQMLKVAGRLADGTATWMGGPKYLAEVAIPTISAAAREAGRPAPRIVSGFPVAVTGKKEAAIESAAQSFAMYGQLPSYRAVLDMEGAEGPASVAIVGSEDEVARQLKHLAEAGVTDFNGAPFGVSGDPEAPRRTAAFLSGLARAGGISA
jgi:F420-dependent oxidoreductase-like protein